MANNNMNRTIYQIVMPHEDGYTAWAKAPADVFEILRRMGAKDFVIPSGTPGRRWSMMFARLRFYCSCVFGPLFVSRNSVFFLQYPETVFYGRFGRELGHLFLRILLRMTRSTLVALIHDLEELRLMGVGEKEANWAKTNTKRLLTTASVVIAHNEKMIDWFVSRGEKRESFVSLGVFDYLAAGRSTKAGSVGKDMGVVVAGFLDPVKAGYLKFLPDIQVQWHLFGIGISDDLMNCDRITYHGAFPPDELLDKLNFSFGLVWDGTSAEGCRGSVGEYQRYNNPHRLSLYLAAAMPVIIWREAAEASFVLENNVGIVVDSLYEIPAAVQAISDCDYGVMAENAAALSEKVRTGCYVRKAIQESLRRV